MKSAFKVYLVIWSVLFVAFQLIALVAPGWIGIEKYTTSLWIGYVFILLSFAVLFGCAIKVFGNNNLQKFFYGIPLVKISYTGLIVTFIFGGLCMFLSLLSGWVAAIICIIVSAINILAVLKAGAAGEIVGEIDDKIKSETHFIKLYTIKAADLEAYAKTETAKAETKKIAEAFRYSDPMSTEELEVAEVRIELAFEKFENAVKLGSDGVSALSEELERLIKARNNECRMMKG